MSACGFAVVSLSVYFGKKIKYNKNSVNSDGAMKII